ncbi:NAD(P)-dependent oxidoreductase [Candidatus Pelagibacter sp.]|jgi:lactate dehydrogenase-like 2-hydroxyacid dehydrogenase|nr:NAD(P)-dependent oxidoreductase [Candidatus Pelagibacter sp.]
MKKKFNIALSFEVGDLFLREIKKRKFYKNFNFKLIKKDLSNFENSLLDSEVFVTKYLDIPLKFYPKLKKMKLIQTIIADYSKINLKNAKEFSVKVTNNEGANSSSVAEHIIMFMIILYRNFVEQYSDLKKGKWNNLKDFNLELEGKTLGILGMGHIGMKLASRANAFGMKVIYYDTLKKNRNIEKKFNIKFYDKKKLIKLSDFLSINVSERTENKDLINYKTFNLMKKNSIIINTSRGSVLNEYDLIKAIHKKKIAGAALDVFKNEPLTKKSKILKYKNIIVTPHCGPSKESYFRRCDVALKNINKIIKNQKIIGLK